MLLVRDAADVPGGVEVFMARRHVASGFVGGAYVFPGGRVDPTDVIDPRLAGLDDEAASRRLGLDQGGLAHYVAAIRECFEEAGVLLAHGPSGGLLRLDEAAVAARFADWRRELNAGRASLAALLEHEHLRLATDRVAYWSHWITPIGEPRRFDTRFFITRAPERQTAVHDDHELTTSAWVTPREAIERALRREWMVIFPTLMNLKLLAQHSSADAAVAWAARQPLPLVANLPRVRAGRVVLPGDEGYDEADADISSAGPEVFERSFTP